MNSLEILVIGSRPEKKKQSVAEGVATTAPGGTRLHAGTLEEARRILETTSPDVVLVDRVPPQADELDLLRTFRNRDHYLPLVLLTDEDGTAVVPPVLHERADHRISREALLEEAGGENLADLLDGADHRVDEHLKILELELIDETNFDLLTKLPDGTALRNQLDRYLEEDHEVDRPFALISVRIDGLDDLHEDRRSELLRWAADLLTVSVRDEDFVAREDEAHFFVVTPPGPRPRVLNLARNLRAELQELNERLPEDPAERPTCRIGLATPDPSVETSDDLIQKTKRSTNTTGSTTNGTVRDPGKALSSYLNRFFRDQSPVG